MRVEVEESVGVVRTLCQKRPPEKMEQEVASGRRKKEKIGVMKLKMASRLFAHVGC